MKTSKIMAGLILLVCLTGSGTITAQPFPPVNENTIPEAKALLTYLYSLRGNQILSGQHNYGHELTRSTDSIEAFTGKTPAIWGSDFIPYDFKTNIHLDHTFNEALKQHRSGSIITMMYHQSRPYADSMGHFRDKMDEEAWNQLMTPGTPIHQTWLKDIDKVAGYLKQFQENKVPVLWRPYHEMNGAWFWWGQKLGPNGYVKLWKMLYERLTGFHQLNNLIWVWNANAPRDWEGDEALAYELFYPGHEYVDVLAADIYKGDYKQTHHDQLLELGEGRLMALGEIGQVPKPEVLNQQSQWAWFMIWARFPWTANTKQQIEALYDHPRVITRNELAYP
ncbi:MAG: glycosyl hydrolase [Candidatus Cyclobacteriaceae bacterium M3_2C_046]